MVAEFESDLIRLRTREGMKVAKAKGRPRGKQPKLKPNQAKHLLELHDSGSYTQTELAELFGVGRSTGYRNPTQATRTGATIRTCREASGVNRALAGTPGGLMSSAAGQHPGSPAPGWPLDQRRWCSAYGSWRAWFLLCGPSRATTSCITVVG